jgi:hypothetical protein
MNSKEWSREWIRRAVWNALHGRSAHELSRGEIFEIVADAMTSYKPNPKWEPPSR